MTKYNNLLLKNQLCFSLYAATNSITRYYRFYLKEIGITYPQYLVLITLWESSTSTASEIGAILKLDLPTITPVLQKLDAMGFIVRKRSEQDNRVVLVSLTKKGLEIEKTIAEIQNKVACKTHLTDDEFNKLKNTLNELTETMEVNKDDQDALIKLKKCV
ncbi:MarR family transcriptional regulator [Methylophilaceae bacterium]|jgi:MarR family transcriptional regulator, organic hydroperoxide resistance regulator|nr:MarR family transcriptional regulator [Methylophilaceae bacterium]|tara:strand:+ start:206 stop:685 length:480 start_codon:yes stop_codon:yes gene_type:complete